MFLKFSLDNEANSRREKSERGLSAGTSMPQCHDGSHGASRDDWPGEERSSGSERQKSGALSYQALSGVDHCAGQ
jgi:hypothetical protein